MFRTFDSDNSGKIDFKEFLLAINITSAGKPEQKLEWAFQMYDVNGDGTIEPSEMCEIITVNITLYPLRHIGAISDKKLGLPFTCPSSRFSASFPAKSIKRSDPWNAVRSQRGLDEVDVDSL